MGENVDKEKLLSVVECFDPNCVEYVTSFTHYLLSLGSPEIKRYIRIGYKGIDFDVCFGCFIGPDTLRKIEGEVREKLRKNSQGRYK